MAAPNIEHRMATGLQASGRTLTGYAAVFNADTRVGDFIERIAPGAFIRSLESGRDVLALADHDPKTVLGRTSSGTLALSEDSHGLAFTLTLPDTTAGRDLAALAARGDLGGMSFGFVPADEVWTGDTRELREVELHEVCVVQSWPAYPQTSVALRMKQARTPARMWLETCK
ncbi:HK97 family phage prohead protease [Brachymonas chironomi]|uniref:HK97 family phage prohead protease n=1 Tax=Brachymonas chironomi TaxID=491919 RepID=UPI00037D06C5|nr:HK97 family phage prohead protease [Brachymonas chironomi]